MLTGSRAAMCSSAACTHSCASACASSRPRRASVCESRCFWQAVVTNSCFYPDAIVDIHAPVDANTGELNRRAADILISETKPPGVQRFLKTSGAGYRTELTRLSGRDLIAMGAPSCR